MSTRATLSSVVLVAVGLFGCAADATDTEAEGVTESAQTVNGFQMEPVKAIGGQAYGESSHRCACWQSVKHNPEGFPLMLTCSTVMEGVEVKGKMAPTAESDTNAKFRFAFQSSSSKKPWAGRKGNDVTMTVHYVLDNSTLDRDLGTWIYKTTTDDIPSTYPTSTDPDVPKKEMFVDRFMTEKGRNILRAAAASVEKNHRGVYRTGDKVDVRFNFDKSNDGDIDPWCKASIVLE